MRRTLSVAATALALSPASAQQNAPAKPQTPEPPFPYETREVWIERPGSVRLSGTLTLPAGVDAAPAAILLGVAGPNDRNQAFAGHHGFWVLADHLTRAGFATLRFDDRGTGESTGEYFDTSYDDLAADALAWIDGLQRTEGVDATKIGVIGNSEGASIGALAASRSADVAFVVMLAGAGLPTVEILADQTNRLAAASSLPPEAIERYKQRAAEMLRILTEVDDAQEAADLLRPLVEEELRMGAPTYSFVPEDLESRIDFYLSPWYQSMVRFDAPAVLGKVSAPVLAMTGELDTVLPAHLHLPAILDALIDAGNRDATVALLPRLNHVFQTARTGSPLEYALLEESFAPLALDTITGWLIRRFAVSPDSGGGDPAG